MSNTFFVYGTLRRRSPAHGLLAASRFLAKASVRGILYDLGLYPGLVRANANSVRVAGELYELPKDSAPSILRTLDRYEGREFIRRRIFVTLPSGRRRAAWTYILRAAPPKRTRKVANRGSAQRKR